MKRTNKNISKYLRYIAILEDKYFDNHNIQVPLMTIKEILLTFKEDIFRYRNRIGRLKNEVRRLNKIIGELNGSSS